MNGEIIQSVAYDNYDDFQHVNFLFSFHYFEDYLKTKLTLGKGSTKHQLLTYGNSTLWNTEKGSQDICEMPNGDGIYKG